MACPGRARGSPAPARVGRHACLDCQREWQGGRRVRAAAFGPAPGAALRPRAAGHRQTAGRAHRPRPTPPAPLCSLRVRFSDNYPLDPPEFVFLPPAPVHPHVFSCGHIWSVRWCGGGGWRWRRRWRRFEAIAALAPTPPPPPSLIKACPSSTRTAAAIFPPRSPCPNCASPCGRCSRRRTRASARPATPTTAAAWGGGRPRRRGGTFTTTKRERREGEGARGRFGAAAAPCEGGARLSVE